MSIPTIFIHHVFITFRNTFTIDAFDDIILDCTAKFYAAVLYGSALGISPSANTIAVPTMTTVPTDADANNQPGTEQIC